MSFLHQSLKRKITAIRREEEGRDLEKKGRERDGRGWLSRGKG